MSNLPTEFFNDPPRRCRPSTYEATLALVRELSENATLRPSPFILRTEPEPAPAPDDASPTKEVIQ